MELELSLSGRSGGTKLRGRVVGALARPASARLEGLGPFGRPVFYLVATSAGDATLVLPRDDRVIVGEPPAAILEALVGVPLGPDDLRAVLTGCVVADARPVGGRAYPERSWIAVDLEGGATAYLREVDGTAVLSAGLRGGLQIEYDEFQRGLPRWVRVTSTSRSGEARAGAETDLTATISQLRINLDLHPQVFSLEIPAGAVPMTLEELRRSGPLGASDSAGSSPGSGLQDADPRTEPLASRRGRPVSRVEPRTEVRAGAALVPADVRSLGR